MTKEQLLRYVKQIRVTEDDARSISSVVGECQAYIQNNIPEHAKSSDRKLLINKLIVAYVEKNLPFINGCDTLEEVVKVLRVQILEKGIITPWYNNDTPEGKDTEEIQLNGPSQIWVKKNGKQQLLDIEFESDEEYEKFVKSLILPNRLSDSRKYVDMATPEGYRINATDKSIEKRGYYTVTIRKLNTGAVDEAKVIGEYKSFTVNMYRLLSLIPRAGKSWFCIGGTGSGKTTLNQMIIPHIPLRLRTITVESPSELNMYVYDGPKNRIINNVLQMVAKQVSKGEEDAEHSPSMQRIFINMLRQTPDIIGVGELRFAHEFELCLRASISGHVVFSTYHSEGILQALRRFLNEMLTATNGADPKYLMSSITDAIGFIIFQARFGSGQRKVMEIAEIVDCIDGEPIHNSIYKFFPTESTETEGVQGEFRRIGCISESMKEKLIIGEVPRNEWEFLTKPIAEVTAKHKDEQEPKKFKIYQYRDYLTWVKRLESGESEYSNIEIIDCFDTEHFDVTMLAPYLPAIKNRS